MSRLKKSKPCCGRFGWTAGIKFLKKKLGKLREILGGKLTVPLCSNRLSLYEKLCWTDLWEFGDLYCRVTPFLMEDLSSRNPSTQLEPLLFLYQGPFLSDETAHWAINRREELASHRAELVKRFTMEQNL